MSEFNRRNFLKTLGAAGLSLSLPSVLKQCLSPTKRPNILFIMSDDHAAHALSCYGSRINQTPNLDRIAREGMRFDNCFCTNSICAPSRASILTGKYSHRNGQKENGPAFDGSQQTFPKLLQAAGYETALIGKWHLKSDPTGFDYYKVVPGQGKYFDPIFREKGSGSELQEIKGYAPDIIADQAMAWIEQRDPATPFLCMTHFKAPHRRWDPAPKYYQQFKDRHIPEPEDLYTDHATKSQAVKEAQMTLARHMQPADTGGPAPPHLQGRALVSWRYQHFIRRYLSCVAAVDENVGRLLDFLTESGLEKDTIVVYTSDQGFFLGDHGWFDKRVMYEEALRMPFLIKHPGSIKSGSVNDDIVLNIDFAPTCLSFAGLAVPADIQGRSFQSLCLSTTPRNWRQAMYYHYYEYPDWHMVDKHYGIRTDRYKLIHFYGYTDAWEFYDLAEDPGEQHNRYPDSAYHNVIADLKDRLYQLQSYYGESKPAAGQIPKADYDKY